MHLFSFAFWLFIAPANPRKPLICQNLSPFSHRAKAGSAAAKFAGASVRVQHQKTEAG